MRVYRVEHRHYINEVSNHYLGPYTSTYMHFDSVTAADLDSILVDYGIMSSSSISPSPAFDGISENHAGMFSSRSNVFGFASIEALLTWFGGALDQMEAFGYIVREYEVPDNYVYAGRKQVVFDSTQAECSAEFGSVRALRRKGNIYA